jgi:hypothetical protein
MTKRKSTTEIVQINFNLQKWLNGTISSEDYDIQGVFISLCAYYGNKGCNVKIEEVYRHFKSHPALERLKQRFFKIDENGFIKIKYVDEEFSEKIKEKIKRQQNGKLGGLKAKQIKKEKSATSSTEVVKPGKPKTAKPKVLKEDFAERKKKFGLTLQPYAETYGREMLKDFYKYWTEPLQKGGGNRFRQEAELAWDLSRRLETWFNSNYEKKGIKKPNLFDNAPKPGIYVPKPKPEVGESLEAVEKRIALELEQKANTNKKESHG